MAKLNKKVHKIYNETFQISLNLIVNCSWDECIKEVNKIMGEKWSDPPENEGEINGRSFCVLTDNRGERRRFIWLPCFEWRVGEMSFLVHEILHWIVSAFVDKQIPFRDENEETIAYLLEWATYVCFSKLRPKKK